VTSFDRTIGRLLIAVTYVATALLVIGVLLMLVPRYTRPTLQARADITRRPRRQRRSRPA
jgi:hypothetical protein